MGLSYNEKRYAKKIGKWLWRLFKKEKQKRDAAKLTDHKPSSSLAPPIPRTVDEFLSLRDRIANTPEGGATCFILALINYVDSDPSVHAEGASMMILSISEENLIKSSSETESYNGYGLHRSDIDRLARATPDIAHSYIAGATPENDYTIQNPNCASVGFRKQDDYTGTIASGTKKVFVWSGGAATARPLTLTCNVKGIWKVKEFSSIVVEVQPPASASNPAMYAAHSL
ncbi:hypothetical protein M9435_004395 [Picochlorum sp. BPE23]|nr:hypothetical protein M9435_004395 [Picochlorum sp. BPE23]